MATKLIWRLFHVLPVSLQMAQTDGEEKLEQKKNEAKLEDKTILREANSFAETFHHTAKKKASWT